MSTLGKCDASRRHSIGCCSIAHCKQYQNKQLLPQQLHQQLSSQQSSSSTQQAPQNLVSFSYYSPSSPARLIGRSASPTHSSHRSTSYTDITSAIQQYVDFEQLRQFSRTFRNPFRESNEPSALTITTRELRLFHGSSSQIKTGYTSSTTPLTAITPLSPAAPTIITESVADSPPPSATTSDPFLTSSLSDSIPRSKPEKTKDQQPTTKCADGKHCGTPPNESITFTLTSDSNEHVERIWPQNPSSPIRHPNLLAHNQRQHHNHHLASAFGHRSKPRTNTGAVAPPPSLEHSDPVSASSAGSESDDGSNDSASSSPDASPLPIHHSSSFAGASSASVGGGPSANGSHHPHNSNYGIQLHPMSAHHRPLLSRSSGRLGVREHVDQVTSLPSTLQALSPQLIESVSRQFIFLHSFLRPL